MESIKVYKAIIENLILRYGNLEELKTNNDVLNTNIYTNPSDFINNGEFILSKKEILVLECNQKNGNYLLATTDSLYSLFEGKKYSMSYGDFLSSDRFYFSNNRQIAEGKTRTFKYILKSGKEFFYEIDSLSSIFSLLSVSVSV